MTETVDDRSRHRGAGPRGALARAALLLGYQFDAAWLERRGRSHAVLMVSTGAVTQARATAAGGPRGRRRPVDPGGLLQRLVVGRGTVLL